MIFFFIKDLATIKGKNPPNQRKIAEASEDYSSPLTIQIDDYTIKIFFYSDKKIFAELDIIDNELFIDYLTKADVESNRQFDEILQRLDKAVALVLGVVKYYFDYSHINEHLFLPEKTLIYRNNNWIECADKRKLSWHYSNPFSIIDEKTLPLIQHLANNNFFIFYAFKFLHKAKNEDNLRDKWIFAATAAEVAIKEFLIHKNPTFETLLLNLPSPPIEKLYGKVLEDISGQPSPYKNKLSDGSQKRNKLIHVPDSPIPSYDETVRYIDIVEKAIFDLLIRLYPTENIFKQKLEGVNNNQRVKT